MHGSPVKLTELEPRFLKITSLTTMQDVESLGLADGVIFLCPKCFGTHGGAVGTHSVICWRPHVGQEHTPIPGRWQFEGTGLHDLTLVAGSSSVLLTSWCQHPDCKGWHGWPVGGGPPCADGRCAGWHGFIRNGEVSSC